MGEEGIDSNWNGPNGPKRIMGTSQAHERAHETTAEGQGTVLRERHLKEPNGPSFVLVQHLNEADWGIPIKCCPLRIAEKAFPSLTLLTIASEVVLY